jgi:DNA-binding response OmpR family regulator
MGYEWLVSSFFMLIALDVMLPGIDGFEVLKRLRQTSRSPILMLTSRGAAHRILLCTPQRRTEYIVRIFLRRLRQLGGRVGLSVPDSYGR